MFEEREIYRAIAEVAYAVARAGDGLQSEELEHFYSAIQEELDYKAWMAESRFDLLKELHPDPEKCFLYALSELRKYKSHITPSIKSKAMAVIESVANSYHGKNKSESAYISRFKEVLAT